MQLHVVQAKNGNKCKLIFCLVKNTKLKKIMIVLEINIVIHVHQSHTDS